MLSSDSVSLRPFTRTNKHKKAVIKNRCNLGTRMIKLENAGLRAPRKISLGSRLHSQKSIRAPVSKMIGLRAPQQKFSGLQGPPFGTLIWSLKRPIKSFCISCRVLRISQLHNNVSKKCNLCLQEKHFIIFRKDLSSLNKRNKLASLLSGSFK